ncbi:peptidase [Dickeya dianthicola]|uniref:peptidase n=1 Tax=Dickeya dianthicola TaxID=204039 RepID=UPI000CD423E6|nr:peptidase [Dickeya dianthicola]MBI0437119.1 peptidase [Dickeya dianthicola]MBI0448653.1 peptidase [Dickeya dianthicola]MBI0452080.1 peptidase [Dickeya dianthicola]MBI0456342.1 peptidase [Dickeya dianthicola]MBI0460474.1 peptidase [Dickeya dianthicola]
MSEAAAPEAPAGGSGFAPATEPAAPTGNEPSSGDPAKPADEPEKPEEQKTEAELAAEKEAAEKAEKDKKPEGAPEKYEFQVSEGASLDTEALKDFEPVARDLNLTNEQAQKLVDAYPKILAGVQQRQAEAWQKQTEGWAESVKADKEIGGDRLTSSISAAQRALETFGTPELKEYLNETGLGNHPELVKAFVKVGIAMSEDSVITGKESGQRTAAEVLYGK